MPTASHLRFKISCILPTDHDKMRIFPWGSVAYRRDDLLSVCAYRIEVDSIRVRRLDFYNDIIGSVEPKTIESGLINDALVTTILNFITETLSDFVDDVLQTNPLLVNPRSKQKWA